MLYALLLTLPLVYMYLRAPSLEWQKALTLGACLCLAWYLINFVAIVSLAPIGELGFFKSIKEVSSDLIIHHDLPGVAFAYPLYRSRLLISFIGVAGIFFALAQTPFGRGLGLHSFFKPFEDYKISERTTHGSARWGTEKELRNYLKASGPGTILGKSKEGKPYILPYENKFEYQRNQNVAIFGTTGSGKTVSFVMPNILQADTSYVITDPKQELFETASPYLRQKGYDVYKLNLVNMADKDTNCWNPLVRKDGSCDFSIQDAVLMASGIIKNTREAPGEKRGDPFWDDSQLALFTALILYASKHFKSDHADPEKNYNKTFSDILRFATQRPSAAMDYDFAHIPKSDPAFGAYSVYKQANEKIRSSIMISFGVRMQLFNDDKLARITSRSDFDLADLGKKKTAVFVNISDYDSTYNMISALFFIQAFQELYKLASQTKGTTPVRFIMDEFCNIGYIPDYTVKLSTMRSRGIYSQMIIQSLEQLKNRYPFGMAAEIIGNSDTRILMGANDRETAEYFSEMIGDATVGEHNISKSDRVPVDAGSITYREQKRPLITPDEITRLPNKEQIVLLRGSYPARIQKIHYSEHPSGHMLKALEQPKSSGGADKPDSSGLINKAVPEAPPEASGLINKSEVSDLINKIKDASGVDKTKQEQKRIIITRDPEPPDKDPGPPETKDPENVPVPVDSFEA